MTARRMDRREEDQSGTGALGGAYLAIIMGRRAAQAMPPPAAVAAVCGQSIRRSDQPSAACQTENSAPAGWARRSIAVSFMDAGYGLASNPV